MMNRIFPTLGLLLFLSFNMSAAGPLKPFPKDGKWGFVDKDMNIVVPCVYDAVSSFDNGSAISTNSVLSFILLNMKRPHRSIRLMPSLSRMDCSGC